MDTFNSLTQSTTSSIAPQRDQQQVLRAEAIVVAHKFVQEVKRRGSNLAARALRPPVATKRQLLRDYGRSQYRIAKISNQSDDNDQGVCNWQWARKGTRTSIRVKFIEGVSRVPREVYDAAYPIHRYHLQVINLGASNLGDKGLIELCDVIVGAPIETLVLSDNHITSAGAIHLGKVLRSFGQLKSLLLNTNNIGDEGVAAFTQHTQYSGTLERLNLQVNPITVTACYQLNSLFHPDFVTSLRAICLGGQSPTHGLEDRGTTLLVAGLLRPRIYPLEELVLPDCKMTEIGAQALAALLYCSDYIRFLNVSRNPIGQEGLHLIRNGLLANTSLQRLEMKFCKVSRSEADAVQAIVAHRPLLSWVAKRQLAADAIATVDHVVYYRSKYHRYVGRNDVGVDFHIKTLQSAKLEKCLNAWSLSRRRYKSADKRSSGVVAAWHEAVSQNVQRDQQSRVTIVHRGTLETKLTDIDNCMRQLNSLRESRELRQLDSIADFALSVDPDLGVAYNQAAQHHDSLHEELRAWLSLTAIDGSGHIHQGVAIATQLFEATEQLLMLTSDVMHLRHAQQHQTNQLQLQAQAQQKLFCEKLTAATCLLRQLLSTEDKTHANDGRRPHSNR